MKEDVISQSFSTIIKPISFVGLYPPEKSPFFFKLRSYILYISLLVLILVLAMVNLVTEKKVDLVELTDMWIFVVQTGFATFKTLPFIIRGHKVKKCINYFGHGRFRPKNKEEERIIGNCIKVCQRNCKIYLYGVTSAVVLWLIPAFMSKDGKLPVMVWLPYDGHSSSIIYYSTFGFLLLANTYDVVASLLTDPLIASLSYHATTRLKILKYNLENLAKLLEKGSGKEQTVITFESAYDILKMCIEHHNDILDFVAEFERCFSWSIFCQVAGSVLTLCCCFIGFTISATSVDAVKYLICYVVIIAQEFFYCYYGTLLTEENNDLMNSICNGPWYKYDTRIRKIFIIIMERSKRPVKISAGKVVDLNLETYTSILKTSYSLFTVSKNFK